MSRVASASGIAFDTEVDVLIIGAGAAGLIAALSAISGGVLPVVVERDAFPRGSTALSAGLIPAAGTTFQRTQGIADSVELFRGDILAKSHGTSDPTVLDAATASVGPTLDWLHERYGLAFDVIADLRTRVIRRFACIACRVATVVN
jgi:fumarate reductase flavoprotein subunit